MELDTIWEEYGIEQLQQGIDRLFPQFRIPLEELLAQLLQGDVLGAMSSLLQGTIRGMSESALGIKNILVWLVVLGVLSALLTHFVEVFDHHQIADLSFYFIYLLLSVILLKCFSQSISTAVETMENIVLFVKLLVPTYLLTLGVAVGTVTVSGYYQLLLLLIYGVQKLLAGVVVPMIYSYCLLSMVNGVWVEEKLSLLMELLEKAVDWILKAALGIVTGISLFQTVITPVIDSMKTSAIQKALSALPGVGNAAEGVLELAVGSAVVIKNSIGVLLLLLLLGLCAAPLLEIFLTSVLIKGAAALMGIVSDKRVTNCADRTGNACMLLLRTVGTAMLLFLISIAILAVGTR